MVSMSDAKRELHITFLNDVDHRTLFSIEEVEAAYALEFDAEQAKSFALEVMDTEKCPIVPGQPAFFAEHLLKLLSRLSPDVARRVRIAGGVPD
jgi:hypothetical protein